MAQKELEGKGYTTQSEADFAAFLNPSDEDYTEILPGSTPEQLLECVAEAFMPEDPPSDDEVAPPPVISVDEAIASLQKLQLYVEQGEIRNEEAGGLFDRMNSQLLRQRVEKRHQNLRQMSLHELLLKQN
jgi:hypothetical protein